MLSFSRVVSTTLKNIAFSTSRTSLQLQKSVCQPSSQYCTEKVEASTEEQAAEVEVIPVEVSMRYLQSAAYAQAYGETFVWEQYRRNHKGYLPPIKTRKTCIRKGAISTGNPCPICRDKYLVLDRRNLQLLKQFISPQTGKVLKASKTGLCQRKHQELLVAVEQAFDYGLLEFDVPFREYDYSEYYKSN